jgi:hypothetical protein
MERASVALPDLFLLQTSLDPPIDFAQLVEPKLIERVQRARSVVEFEPPSVARTLHRARMQRTGRERSAGVRTTVSKCEELASLLHHRDGVDPVPSQHDTPLQDPVCAEQPHKITHFVASLRGVSGRKCAA